MARHGTVTKAVQSLGFASEYAFPIMNRLAEDRKIKPIFGSPKAHELYCILKAKHLFVFPEVPICAIIHTDLVAHLFTERWHKNYFLTARLDFLVCDQLGLPRFGVEYHGTYHTAPKQKRKDAFKELLLKEVGIPLRVVRYQDVRVMKRELMRKKNSMKALLD